MESPYRGREFAGGAAFSQHIGIAEDLLQQLIELARRHRRFQEAELAGREDRAREIEQRAKALWDDSWSRLDEAAAVVRANDRSAGDFERARLAARAVIWPLTFSFGPWVPTAFGRRRLVTGRFASVEPSRLAVAALRAAVPEVAESFADGEPAPAPEPATGARAARRRRAYWAWLVGAALIAWTAARWL